MFPVKICELLLYRCGEAQDAEATASLFLGPEDDSAAAWMQTSANPLRPVEKCPEPGRTGEHRYRQRKEQQVLCGSREKDRRRRSRSLGEDGLLSPLLFFPVYFNFFLKRQTPRIHRYSELVLL